MPSSTAASTLAQPKDMLSYRATSKDTLDLSRNADEDLETYCSRVTEMAEEVAYKLAVQSGSNYVEAMKLYPQEVPARWSESEKDYQSCASKDDLTKLLPSLKTRQLSDFTDATAKAALNMTTSGQTASSLNKLVQRMEHQKTPNDKRTVELSIAPTYNGGKGKGNVILRSSWSTKDMKKPLEFGSSRISLDTQDLYKPNSKASAKMTSHAWGSSPPSQTDEELFTASKTFSTRMERIDKRLGRKPMTTVTQASESKADAAAESVFSWLSRKLGFGNTSTLITSTA